MISETETTEREFDLVAIIPSPQDRGRIRSALAERRAQLFSEFLDDPEARVMVLAVIGADGAADLFISRNQSEEALPALSSIAEALQELLATGSYRHGALLVLGRIPQHQSDLRGGYASLLSRLQAQNATATYAERCARSIAGVAGQRSSLVTTILWWELGRATSETPSLLTVHALNRAQSAFAGLDARWQAQRARSAAREVEDAIQLELFGSPRSVSIDTLRYELVPTYYSSGRFQCCESWASATNAVPAAWRSVDQVQLTLGLDGTADFDHAPLALKSSAVVQKGDAFEIQVSVDFGPRIYLQLDRLAGSRIRYSITGDAMSAGIQLASAAPGATVAFDLNQLSSREKRLNLTCVSDSGQTARFTIDVLRAHRGGDDRSLRIRETAERFAAYA